MASSDIVTDLYLRSVLESSAQAREQCMKTIDQVERKYHAAQDLPSLDDHLEMSKDQKRMYSVLARLRGLNRNAILKVRNTKQTTAEARQEIDRLHLHLQNLYYEERHLKGEIGACESYDHKYKKLPLVPVEDFLEQHPEHADDDEKGLMVARIQHELSEREDLEKQRQELLKQKAALDADNKKRKEDLAKLDKQLETFIDAGLPIQKLLEKEY